MFRVGGEGEKNAPMGSACESGQDSCGLESEMNEPMAWDTTSICPWGVFHS